MNQQQKNYLVKRIDAIATFKKSQIDKGVYLPTYGGYSGEKWNQTLVDAYGNPQRKNIDKAVQKAFAHDNRVYFQDFYTERDRKSVV